MLHAPRWWWNHHNEIRRKKTLLRNRPMIHCCETDRHDRKLATTVSNFPKLKKGTHTRERTKDSPLDHLTQKSNVRAPTAHFRGTATHQHLWRTVIRSFHSSATRSFQSCSTTTHFNAVFACQHVEDYCFTEAGCGNNCCKTKCISRGKKRTPVIHTLENKLSAQSGKGGRGKCRTTMLRLLASIAAILE